MPRSILTGIFTLLLSASAFGFAAADETGATMQSNPSSSSSTATASQASSEAAAAVNETGDAALPTAGADLAMWNVAPAVASDGATPTVLHNIRLQRFASGIVNRSSAIASSLTRSAMRFIGTPYVFGGTRSTGFDCSGYVQHVFAMLGFRLPRTADAQFDAGHRIASTMEPGDLVFFHTYAPGVSHVGIYLGQNKFIHSSSSHGVSISSLHDSYWAPRYLGAKRVFGS